MIYRIRDRSTELRTEKWFLVCVCVCARACRVFAVCARAWIHRSFNYVTVYIHETKQFSFRSCLKRRMIDQTYPEVGNWTAEVVESIQGGGHVDRRHQARFFHRLAICTPYLYNAAQLVGAGIVRCGISRHCTACIIVQYCHCLLWWANRWRHPMCYI